jgi:Zn-finger nucleic acid-binding protein
VTTTGALPPCPRCHQPALVADVGALHETVCADCHGRLLPREAVEELVVGQLGHPPSFLQELAEHFQSRGVRCPTCENEMALMRLRGEPVDLCTRCGVAWLDAGELSRLSGGRFEEPTPPPRRRTFDRRADAAAREGAESRGRNRLVPAGIGLAFGLLMALLGALLGASERRDAHSPDEPSGAGLESRLFDLERGCENAHGPSCAALYRHYREGSDAADPSSEIRVARRLCELGVIKECRRAADRFRSGKGAAKRIDVAVALYEDACDHGNAGACAWAGYAYGRGEGVLEDRVRALTFYRRACAGGHRPSCDFLRRVDEREAHREDQARAREGDAGAAANLPE